MADINEFALQQAVAAAARLWAFGSAQFPLATGHARVIQAHIDQSVTETAIAFAIHARRLLDNWGIQTRFTLDVPFRHWSPLKGMTKETNFRDALNRIVHATEFEVGFESLPETMIEGGAIGVIYLKTETERRNKALIDVFALASCFFYRILPELRPPGTTMPGTYH
jgi:hypothetical protein